MNSSFREYVFGRSFTLSLTKQHVDTLAALCQAADPVQRAIASYGLANSGMHGLLRRGLVERYVDESPHCRYRPTRAGLLVYDLMVEAGEFEALEEQRRLLLEEEHRLQREEWDRRFGEIKISLRERFQRLGAASSDAGAEG